LQCIVKRACKGECQALLPKCEFDPGEWEHARWPSSKQGYCRQCMAHGNWTCVQCDTKKPKADFKLWMADPKHRHKNQHSRCDACIQETNALEEENKKKNLEQVAKRPEIYACAAPFCANQNIKKSADEFDKWILRNFKGHQRTLVCKICEHNGYSVRAGGLQTHDCVECGPGGHNKFDKNDLKNKSRRPTMKLLCTKCKSKTK
jgi:hypothetical protein